MVVSLAACGGGASDDGHSQTTPPVSYTVLEAQSDALHTVWDSVAFTDPSTLPPTGAASFSGVAQLDVENAAGEISMDGMLTLLVLFPSSTVSGSAVDFVDENNAAYSGVLSLGNGALNRAANPVTEYTFSADLAGSLSGAGEIYNVTTDMSGDFHGVGFGATSGAIVGTAVSSFGTGYVFGQFIAQQ